TSNAAAEPEGLIGIRCKVQMVRGKARTDQGELSRHRVVRREMPIGFFNWERFGRRMVGALFTHIRIFAGPDTGREPDSSFLVHHGIVVESLAVPDRFRSPVSRRAERVVLR